MSALVVSAVTDPRASSMEHRRRALGSITRCVSLSDLLTLSKPSFLTSRMNAYTTCSPVPFSL